MKVDQKGNTVTIKDTQGDLVLFLMKFTHEYKTFANDNIIIDISLHNQLSVKDVNGFLKLSKTHRKAKKSFVVVAKDVDFNAFSDKLIVVPSLIEAKDIVEMEEIERDLGF